MGTKNGYDASGFAAAVPGWVPAGALHYIAHTERGLTIRALARAAGCHASTIMRQIRKLEMRRDDPLVDAALRTLGRGARDRAEATAAAIPDEDTLAREAMRVLRRLCEPGAVLAVSAEMEKAVVVRDQPGGTSLRTAVVEAAVAQAMALKDWIAPANTGRIVRYHITGTGRTALAKFLERFGLPGLPEAARDAHLLGSGPTSARHRAGYGESPLAALARRREKDGTRFLDDGLVRAGERLREDFELANMDETIARDWDLFLTSTPPVTTTKGAQQSASAAACARVQEALRILGPGLSDVALRCCCYLEGLETAERRLGWSARSGKIVLRIALIRLKRHYDETVGAGGPMIG